MTNLHIATSLHVVPFFQRSIWKILLKCHHLHVSWHHFFQPIRLPTHHSDSHLRRDHQMLPNIGSNQTSCKWCMGHIEWFANHNQTQKTVHCLGWLSIMTSCLLVEVQEVKFSSQLRGGLLGSFFTFHCWLLGPQQPIPGKVSVWEKKNITSDGSFRWMGGEFAGVFASSLDYNQGWARKHWRP